MSSRRGQAALFPFGVTSPCALRSARLIDVGRPAQAGPRPVLTWPRPGRARSASLDSTSHGHGRDREVRRGRSHAAAGSPGTAAAQRRHSAWPGHGRGLGQPWLQRAHRREDRLTAARTGRAESLPSRLQARRTAAVTTALHHACTMETDHRPRQCTSRLAVNTYCPSLPDGNFTSSSDTGSCFSPCMRGMRIPAAPRNL